MNLWIRELGGSTVGTQVIKYISRTVQEKKICRNTRGRKMNIILIDYLIFIEYEEFIFINISRKIDYSKADFVLNLML